MNIQKLNLGNLGIDWSQIIGSLGLDSIKDIAVNDNGDAVIIGNFQNLLQLGSIFINGGSERSSSFLALLSNEGIILFNQMVK